MGIIAPTFKPMAFIQVTFVQFKMHKVGHFLNSYQFIVRYLFFPFAQEAYYFQAFPLIYQWTSSHHFTVRLYSQQAVFRIWTELSSMPSLRKHFEMMENLISFMKQNRYIISTVSAAQFWSISLPLELPG